jgi:hypothetical protein
MIGGFAFIKVQSFRRCQAQNLLLFDFQVRDGKFEPFSRLVKALLLLFGIKL